MRTLLSLNRFKNVLKRNKWIFAITLFVAAAITGCKKELKDAELITADATKGKSPNIIVHAGHIFITAHRRTGC